MTQPASALDPNDLDPSGELAAQIEAQRREYGTYEADSKIFAGSALAYDIGHPIPISNVLKHGYWLNGQARLQEGAEHDPAVAATLEKTEVPAPSVPVAEPAYLPPAGADPVDAAPDHEGE
jgi:hypothetical protein